MMEIIPKYKNIVEITMKYQTQQYPVMENLFKKLSPIILDYYVVCEKPDDIFKQSVELTPLIMETPFLEVLKQLEDMVHSDEELRDLEFQLSILCILLTDDNGDVKLYE